MSSSDSQATPIRARLDKFDDVAAFVQGYNQYFVKGGLLLPTRRAKPVGSDVSLQLELSDGTTAFRAEGTVQKHRQNKAGETVGMVIKFSRLDARSKAVLERMIAVKKGDPDPGESEPTPATSSPGIQPVATAKAEASLGKQDLAAMVDALDDTFDSIFSGSPSGVFGTLSDEPEDVDEEEDLGPAGDEVIPGRPVLAEDAEEPVTQVSADANPAAHNTAFGIPAFTEDPIALREKLAQTIKPEDEDQPVFEDELPPHELDTNRVPIQQPRSITGTATTMPVEKKPETPAGTVIGMRAIDTSMPRPAPPATTATDDPEDLAGFDEEPASDTVSDSTPLGRIQFNKMSATELEEQRRKKREEREAAAEEVQKAVEAAAGLERSTRLSDEVADDDSTDDAPDALVAPEGLDDADDDAAARPPSERLQQLISSVTGEHAAVNEEAPDVLSQLRAQSGPVASVSHDEDALDDLMGDGPVVNAEPVGMQPDMSVPAPVQKKGIIARFFAWLASLFGGGKK